jgi:hypothetical protein
MAGCIPIYWGARNIGNYIPREDAIVNIDDFHNLQAVVSELERLANNEVAYSAKLMWKTQQLHNLNPSERVA